MSLTSAISTEDLAGFPYVEHAENVALALRMCAISEMTIDRQIALRGMWSAMPDPGVMSTCEIAFFGRKVIFVNGFAANESAENHD